MAAHDNPPRLRSDTAHQRLRQAILGGVYAPGDPLPSERALSERYRVNRHAVREAVRRLEAAGLVEPGPAGVPRVLDWRTTGGLDLLSDLAGVGELAPLLRAVAEMRAAVGADAARLCALCGASELRAELPALARAIPSPAANRRYADRFAAYERLWARIVEGSGNFAYQLALNSLSGARGADGGIDSRAFAAEVDDARDAVPLAEAIAGGDGETAQRLARSLLERTVRATR